MRPEHWLGLVLCVSFVALTLMWDDGKDIRPTVSNPVPLISRGSLSEDTEVEDSKRDWLNQVHLKRRLLNESKQQ